MDERRKVLIAGASFAGLSSAYWMHELGYDVTVVDIASSLKTGGTPVDIRDKTIDIVRRMGLLERVKAVSLPAKSMEFKSDNNSPIGSEQHRSSNKGEGFEVERDTLLAIMFDAVKGNVDFLFGESINSIEEVADGLHVSLDSGARHKFDLVFGCDGVHSELRGIWFGPERQYSYFLGAYGSVSILHKLLIPENRSQSFNAPGRFVSVSSYNGKTDIILILSSDTQITYDHRDTKAKKSIMLNAFTNMGWRSNELLAEVECADYFYFDKLSQIRMPAWTKGRVALVGDAAYCASPAAGRGGSLAIDGAAALADALRLHGADFEAAFAAYNRDFRCFIEEVQAGAQAALKFLVPKTEEALRERNRQFD